MNGDISLLLIGGIIGILGSIVGYCINHLLKLREQRIVREFEIQEKGREFFHQIYGLVAQLSDFATSILREDDSNKSMILIESGYTREPITKIIKRYKQAYEEHAKSWYESRKKGLEVFLPKDLAMNLSVFWAYAGYLYEEDEWNELEKLIDFEEVSRNITETIDKLLGLSEKKSLRPKWLNWKEIHSIIRGNKSV